MRRFPFVIRFSALAATLLLPGCAVHVTAPNAQPNFVVRSKVDGTVTAVIKGATDAEHCSATPGLMGLCVTRLKSALQSSLGEMMAAYVKTGGRDAYTGTLEIVSFGFKPAAVTARGGVPAVYLEMKWKFVLTNSSGEQVIAVAATTVGSKPAASRAAVQDAFGALEAEVLERISFVMNDEIQSWPRAIHPHPLRSQRSTHGE